MRAIERFIIVVSVALAAYAAYVLTVAFATGVILLPRSLRTPGRTSPRLLPNRDDVRRAVTRRL